MFTRSRVFERYFPRSRPGPEGSPPAPSEDEAPPPAPGAVALEEGAPEEIAPGEDRPPGRPGGGVDWPVAVLAGMVGLYAVVFGTLTWRQQSNFGTFAFDMGIYDQGIWLVSRFKEPFNTVRGLNYFAHHVNLITVAFVPFYWLGAGPHFLVVVQTVWMALGAVPVWLLARDRLASPWLALGLAACYLLYPSLEWINWWHFHPDALIITPLLFAWWLATRRRWGRFAVAVAVALLCKEDAAFAVAALGLALILRGQRRAGVLSCLAGIGWFLVATKVIIPAASGGTSPFYVRELFPGFGDSIGAIAVNLVSHPSRFFSAVTKPDVLHYYWQMLAPVAGMPLAAPEVLLIGIPQAAINSISGHALTHDIRYHYSSIVLAAVFLATVESCARLGTRVVVRRALVGLLVASSLAANVAWSPSPLGVRYDSGIWAAHQQRHDAMARAVAQVPEGAGVSASFHLVPHLTHRVHVYEFPNPWIPTNWGMRDRPPDPADVDYLVLDSTSSTTLPQLFDRLVGPGRPFEPVFDASGIVVARRVAPG